MKKQQLLAYVMGTLALLASFYNYLDLRFLGFPDGFLTDLDRGRRILLGIAIGVNILAALGFAFLGLLASSKHIQKQLTIVVITYTSVIALLVVADSLLRQLLLGGGGG